MRDSTFEAYCGKMTYYRYQIPSKFGVWLSLVEHCFREARVASSNLVTPTNLYHQWVNDNGQRLNRCVIRSKSDLVKWRFDDNRLILFIKKFHWARRKDHDHADKFLNLPQYSAHPTIAQYFPYQNLSDILAPPA